MTERWLPVVGYENSYEVSDRGRVRSIDRITQHGRLRTAREMTRRRVRAGHLRVGLNHDNHQTWIFVHRLVLEAFVGLRPEGMICRHLNGIPDDNRLENLKWGTWQENTDDMFRHGTNHYTNKTHCKRGHEFTPANTIVNKKRSGARLHRQCRTCHRDWERQKRSAARVAS